MKKKISITPFEAHGKLNFYSYRINDNPACEMELFLKGLQNRNRTNDAIQFVNLLDKIAQNGAQERYFRYEGKVKDHVVALPDNYMIKSDCRLYCLRYSEALIILGNGGIKMTATYQQDTYLNDCVETLQKIDEEVQKLIKLRDIVISGKTITGKLEFFI